MPTPNSGKLIAGGLAVAAWFFVLAKGSDGFIFWYNPVALIPLIVWLVYAFGALLDRDWQPVRAVSAQPIPLDEHLSLSRLREALSMMGSLLLLIGGAIAAIVAACALAFACGLAIAAGIFIIVVLPLLLLAHH